MHISYIKVLTDPLRLQKSPLSICKCMLELSPGEIILNPCCRRLPFLKSLTKATRRIYLAIIQQSTPETHFATYKGSQRIIIDFQPANDFDEID